MNAQTHWMPKAKPRRVRIVKCERFTTSYGHEVQIFNVTDGAIEVNETFDPENFARIVAKHTAEGLARQLIAGRYKRNAESSARYRAGTND
jgi:hypothetical protein